MSFLEGNGTPSMVERTMIRPPSARIGPVTPEERKAVIDKSPLKGKYDQTVDPESAYEILQKRRRAGGALPPAGPAGAGSTPAPQPARRRRMAASGIAIGGYRSATFSAPAGARHSG